MVDVSLVRASADDIGVLYAIAGAAPESWPHVCGGGLPSPGAFASIVGSGQSSLFLIHSEQVGPVGCVELYDWHAPSGTVWLDVPALPLPSAMDFREAAACQAVDLAFGNIETRKVYAQHHGYESAVFGGLSCPWHVEARTPDVVLHDSHYWDEIVTAVYRDDWFTGN